MGKFIVSQNFECKKHNIKLVSFLSTLFNIKAYRLSYKNAYKNYQIFFSDQLKIWNEKRNSDNQFNFCEHNPPITVFENNLAALSELFAAHLWAATHHLGTPALYYSHPYWTSNMTGFKRILYSVDVMIYHQ